MTSLTIQLSEKEKKGLVQVAHKQKTTTGEVARKAIKHYTADINWQKLESVRRKLAQDLGIKKDSDVVRVFQ